MSWHEIEDIAVKDKGSCLRGSQISMRGYGDEQLVAAYKLPFTKALGLYYHIPNPGSNIRPTIIRVVD